MVVARQMIRQMIKPVDKQLVRSSGKVSTLDIRASVGTSTSPTSTGTRAVTGVGFQPKVVLPFGVSPTAVGTGLTGILGLGAGTSSSNRAAIGVYTANGQTTSATNRRHTAAGITTSTDLASAVWLASDLSTLDSDGFTLNWSTVDASARILNHICLGGADLEVSLTQQQMNGTNAAQSFAHGLSGAPTGVLFFSAINPTVPPNTATVLGIAMGAWAGVTQWGASVLSSNGVATTVTRRILSTSHVLNANFDQTGPLRALAVNSVDATNVNATYPITNSTYNPFFWMLAIRGAKCQVGTFDCNGSLSPLTINTPGITPKLFLPVFVPEGADNLGLVINELALAIGACDGSNNVSCGITDANAVTTTNARRWQSSTALTEHGVGGSLRFQATAAFSGESVVVTPTVLTSASWGQGGFLIIGS